MIFLRKRSELSNPCKGLSGIDHIGPGHHGVVDLLHINDTDAVLHTLVDAAELDCLHGEHADAMQCDLRPGG